MSFSDMMSSARGPGLIGMLLALIVLFGFGGLFMLVTGPEGVPEGQTLKQFVRQQADEIELLTKKSNFMKQTLASRDERFVNAAELRKRDQEITTLAGQITGLEQEIATSEAKIATLSADFENYKNQYRAFVRGKARDMRIPQLALATGVILHEVIVRQVTAVGLQVRHKEGFKRIPFEDLPLELQDYFQFDPAQKAAALAAEARYMKSHESAVAVVKAAAKEREKENQAQAQVQALAQNREEYSATMARIEQVQNEIESLEKQLPLETQKRLSRAPQLRRELANKRKELSALRAKSLQLRTAF